jgi:hypothetical protein
MSAPHIQCLTCKHLGHCRETSADKVMASYKCERWEETRPEIYAARYNIVTKFGRKGVEAVVTQDLQQEDD